jgi:ribonuclease PH
MVHQRANLRAHDRLRPIKITRNYITHIPGSILIEIGNTRVICCATLEDRVPPFLKGTGEGWLRSEYAMLPCSSPTRTPREAVLGRIGGRTHEIQRLIARSLRAIFELRLLGERTIVIDCDVIQADGGTRCASITGSFVALVDLVNSLLREKEIEKDPIRDSIAAVSVGIYNGQVLLDLDYDEDSKAEVDVNVVMTGRGEFVEIQATGEGTTFKETTFMDLLNLARSGIKELIGYQKEILGGAFKW